MRTVNNSQTEVSSPKSRAIMLRQMLEEHPEFWQDLTFLTTITDEYGANALLLTALSGSTTLVRRLLDQFPELSTSEDRCKANLLLYAAWSGSPEMMGWVLNEYPELIKSTDQYGANILHCATRSGSLEAVQWVLTAYPKLIDSKNGVEDTFVHYALLSGSPEVIRWIFLTHPQQAAASWEKILENSQDSPDLYPTEPKAILYSLFKEAMIALDSENSDPLDWQHFLKVFKGEFCSYLDYLDENHDEALTPELISRVTERVKISRESSYIHRLFSLAKSMIAREPLREETVHNHRS